MSDLVARLREMGDRQGRHAFDIGYYWNAVEEAADEIERLETILTAIPEWGTAGRECQICRGLNPSRYWLGVLVAEHIGHRADCPKREEVKP
jgi:hypothetical protein